MNTLRRFQLLLVPIAISIADVSRAAEPSITSLLTPKEKKESGLDKLTQAERRALDVALLRVMARLGQEADDLSFFGVDAKAVAYIDADDSPTIYLVDEHVIKLGTHAARYDVIHRGQLALVRPLRDSGSVSRPQLPDSRHLQASQEEDSHGAGG